MTKTLNVYCCGGTGINLGSHFTPVKGTQVGFADITPYFIDTSKANLNTEINEDQFYLIKTSNDGKEGAGKLRRSRHKEIAEQTPPILHSFQPTDFNLVVHGAAGGSGSVIGPTLVSQLINRDIPVVAIVVGNTSSRIETENTLNTLLSYEAISKLREKPVTVAYLENNKDMSRENVDNIARTMIVSLSALFSGENHELDHSDLFNWLNYPKVTQFKPQLVSLKISVGGFGLDPNESILSLATLATDHRSTDIDHPVEYQAVGFIKEEAQDAFQGELPIHFSIVTGSFDQIIASVRQKLDDYESARKAVIQKTLVDDIDHATDDGLIL